MDLCELSECLVLAAGRKRGCWDPSHREGLPVLNTQPVSRAGTAADPDVGRVCETSFLSPPSLPLYETWPPPSLLQLQSCINL